MKNLSVIINVVLGVAVGVLYILHFTAPDIPEAVQAEYEERSELFGEPAQIVFVNFDSLLNNYDLYFELQKQFVEKQQTLERELTNRSRTYERQVLDFQDKAQKGLITRSQAQEMEIELMQVQQELINQRDEFSRELMEEEQVMNRLLQYSIYEFLEEWNANKDYQYVLSHTFGGPFLYSDKRLNVTNEVIQGLNRKHRESR